MRDLQVVAMETDPIELPDLLGELERAKAIAWSRLVAPATDPKPTVTLPTEDHLITVPEAAKILDVTVGWLYEHADDFAFTRRLPGRKVRCSLTGIRLYLAGLEAA